jgi:hypothetical protein
VGEGDVATEGEGLVCLHQGQGRPGSGGMTVLFYIAAVIGVLAVGAMAFIFVLVLLAMREGE